MSHIHHECELERHIVEQLEAAGWRVGKSADYDATRALFPEDVIGWLDDTQPQAMAKLRAELDRERAMLAEQISRDKAD